MKVPVFVRAALASILGVGLLHAASVKKGAVEAELVPSVTSVQPGQAFDVALRLVHDAHWHTYWLNAGTGYPTKITWTLPPGWHAGDIQWPVPHVLKDDPGNIIGNGYDGEVFLLVTLTPPADLPSGSSVALKANVEWLMCRDVCVPGEGSLELTLPVDAGTPAPHPRWGPKLEAARNQLPHAPDHWQLAAARAGKAVTFSVRPPPGATFAPADFHFFADDELVAYDQPQPGRVAADGTLEFTLPVDPAGPKDPQRLLGVLALAKGDVPGIRVDIPLSTATASQTSNLQTPNSKSAGGAGLLGTLVLAFVGGLILNLMPCVFPVLGIKILGFVNQAGADRRKVTLHGVTFALGVLVSFWVLAGALIALRAGGRELGWGFQLQEPGFVFVLAALLLIFALNLSGLFEVGLSATGVGAGLLMKSGYSGSFFTGVLATVVATPCSAPFLAPALGAALALSAGESLVVFTAIALGLAVPYLLLSIFPGAVKLLPRPGAWMETFKQLMAFPLYATVGFLVWVLAGQTKDNDTALLMVFFGLVLVAMAAWVYGRWTQHGGSAGRRRFGYGLAAVLVGAGLAAGYPAKPSHDIVWEKWSPETVAKLRAEGKTLYVDFTARWCATCQSNKAVVFSSQRVRDALRRDGVVLLKADWTNKDPQITETLASFNRSAVPFDLIYAPNHEQPIILPELLTPDMVLTALARAHSPPAGITKE